MMKHILLLSGLLLLLTWGCSTGKKQEEQKQEKELPARLEERIKLTDLDGKPLDLSQYRGKPIFLNFWATWCRPCLAEFPDIDKAAKIMSQEGFVFLAASDEDIEKIRSFAEKHSYSFRFVHLTVPVFDLEITALPTTMIIDKQGNIVYNEVGARDWGSEEMLNKLRLYTTP